ncbi:MAG: hypothetical protein JXP34_15875 [Planctomycetes bacterium]|nr:hypothetical protein [Planctomycetota bacterium]
MRGTAIGLSVIVFLGAASAAEPAIETFPLDPAGNILAWVAAGPFAANGPRHEALAALSEPPAEGAMLGDKAWRRAFAGAGGYVNLESLFRSDSAVAYAACAVESDREGTATLLAGSDDGIRIWYGGKLVHEWKGRRGWRAAEDEVSFEMRRGSVPLVVEVEEHIADWGFSVAIRPPEGGRARTRLALAEALPGRFVEVDANATGFLEGPEDSLAGVAFLRVRYLGEEGKARIRAGFAGTPGPWESVEIAPGERTYEVAVPVVTEPKDLEIAIRAGEDTATRTVRLLPQRKWEIYIAQHTHTDIGYTATQDDIYREHMRFIDEALACAKATEAYPPEARFRWVCEASWGVDLYLRNRPPQAIRALAEAARAGLVEFTALPMNLTDLATEEVVIRGLATAAMLRARFGVPVVSIQQNDVNGYPWALPRLLAASGVTYFANGINETRSRVPFDVPTALIWESPDGSPLTVFRGFHYLTGNFLGLCETIEKARRELGGTLADLQAKGYPHRTLLLTVGGVLTDNSPPATILCDIVREWNVRWTYPRLCTATLSDFFRALEQETAGNLPRFRKAWPDWWADGNGSAAREVALVRRAHERLAAADAMLAVTGRTMGGGGATLRRRLAEAYESALLFDEHTWGAWSSISDPDGLFAKTQWGFKSSYASRAALDAAELEDAGCAALAWGIPTGDAAALAVFNPLPWERSGIVEARIPITLFDWAEVRVVDNASGEPVPMQVLARDRIWVRCLIQAKGIPALGYRTYRVERGAPAALEPPFTSGADFIDNGFVRVEVDPATGAIRSIVDRQAGGEIVAVRGDEVPYGFGQYVYEQISKEPGRGFLWPIHKDVPFERRTLSGIRVASGESGPLAATLAVEGTIEEKHTVRMEIELRRGERAAHLTYGVRKPATVTPEAVYIAFPFADALPELRLEVAGGVARPGIDQIPGSATDWHSTQYWIRAKGEKRGAVWVTLDAPLVQFGGINMGRYLETLRLPRPTFYSWPMNNYWFTNFPAEQGGEFVLRYVVSAHRGAGTDSLAARFAREQSVPPRAIFIPPRRAGDLPAREASFIAVEPDGVALSGIKAAEDGHGAILRLREIDGKRQAVTVRFAKYLRVERAERTNAMEERGAPVEIREGAFTIELEPHAGAEIRVAPFAGGRALRPGRS